jgi:hypothetical protein
MTRNVLHAIFALLFLALIVAGCGNTPPAPAATAIATATVEQPAPTTVSSTPDPCSPGQIEAEVQKVHKHMREFDDASILASNMPREQLDSSIADLQRIRREAEDEQIPDCLITLKTYQVNHMNSVINTLLAFMGGADKQALDQGIAAAREQHDQYTLELARLLGLTVVPATPGASATPAETSTP